MNTDFKKTLPFMMYRLVARLVAEANEEYGRYGLTIHGVRLLIVTRQNPGIRVGELAEITCVEGSTLSHMLARLERDGLLVRERSNSDNRSVAISLTPRGSRVADAVGKISLAHQDMMLDGLSAVEIKQLRSLVEKMGSNIDRIPAAKAASSQRWAMKRKLA
ncbi:MAG: MarR family transcriptional regulator [Candidatus Lustribacter sp.]|jgi:DNA-binding MarR family transcriptional regulator